MRSSSTRRGAILAVLVVALVGAVAAPARATGEPGVEPLVKRMLGTSALFPCGWMVDVSADTLNVAAPDSNTNYFVQPYSLQEGGEIDVHGLYPAARYFSLITYGADGAPIGDASLHDTEIDPDAGSVNPFRTASPTPPDQAYSIKILGQGTPAGSNTMAGLATDPDTGQVEPGLGFLVYRLYLSTDADDPLAGVPLPGITTSRGPLRTCSPFERRVLDVLFRPIADRLVEASAPDPDQVARGAHLFRRAGNLAGLFPNPDNQYVFEATNWEPGRVVVIRGKAMTFPDTRNGGSVIEATDVRYWSMCSNVLAQPYPVVKCAADSDTALVDGPDGKYYTYVVSMLRDKPRNATPANGVTWLQWAPPTVRDVPPNTTYLRTMLPGEGFDHAVQSAQVDPGAPAIENARWAKEAMAEYYPVGSVCTKARFEQGRC